VVSASDLKTGTILHIEKSLYKDLLLNIIWVEEKTGGLVHVKLKEVRTDLCEYEEIH